MVRRTQPPRPPAAPPADAEEGAARIRPLLVKLFDRHDGKGANWSLLLESLYRIGFDLADQELTADARQTLMRGVHEAAEWRATGGFADGAAASKTDPAEAVSAPSNTAIFKSIAPRPPR